MKERSNALEGEVWEGGEMVTLGRRRYCRVDRKERRREEERVMSKKVRDVEGRVVLPSRRR